MKKTIILFVIIFQSLFLLEVVAKEILFPEIDGSLVEHGSQVISLNSSDELPLSLNTEKDSVANEEADPKKLSRRDVLKYTSYSGLFQLGAIASFGFLKEEEVDDLTLPWWFYGIVMGEHLPLYSLNPDKAKYYTGAELGFLSAHLATRKQGHDTTLVPFHSFFYTATYSTYEVYKEARKLAREDAYQGDWRAHELPELFKASYKREHWEDPWMWGFLLFVAVGGGLDQSGSNDGIWKTGDAYIDDRKVPIGVAVPAMMLVTTAAMTATAVGEESLYRGVVYEEARYEWGSTKAKAFDALFFPTLHVPGDIKHGESSGEITNLFLIRALSTYFFDKLYDRGGLGRSIALHTWSNVVGYMISWAGKSGRPNAERDEKNQNSLAPLIISIGFRY